MSDAECAGSTRGRNAAASASSRIAERRCSVSGAGDTPAISPSIFDATAAAGIPCGADGKVGHSPNEKADARRRSTPVVPTVPSAPSRRFRRARARRFALFFAPLSAPTFPPRIGLSVGSTRSPSMAWTMSATAGSNVWLLDIRTLRAACIGFAVVGTDSDGSSATRCTQGLGLGFGTDSEGRLLRCSLLPRCAACLPLVARAPALGSALRSAARRSLVAASSASFRRHASSSPISYNKKCISKQKNRIDEQTKFHE